MKKQMLFMATFLLLHPIAFAQLTLEEMQRKASYQSDVTEIPVTIPGIDIPTLSKDQYQVVLELNQRVWDGGETRAKKEVINYNAEVKKQKIEMELYGLRERSHPHYSFSFLMKIINNYTKKQLLLYRVVLL